MRREYSFIFHSKPAPSYKNHSVTNVPIVKTKSFNRQRSGAVKKLNIKSKFSKETKIHSKFKKMESEIKSIKIHIVQDEYNNNDKRAFDYKKFIAFRIYIYRQIIINKYYSPYLMLNCNKNEIYINEAQKPRLFHLYIINNILQNKKCNLVIKYNEMAKYIDLNDYIMNNYKVKQSYSILKYLLGCIYNNDKYSYSKVIDDNNNYERIIINYKNTLDGVVDYYNRNRDEQLPFMLSQYISKMNNKDFNYYINLKKYKYLFIAEIPSFHIPIIMPNYLGFSEKINKMIKKFTNKIKYKKIKTNYIKYLIKQENKEKDKKDDNNSSVKRKNEESSEEKEDNDNEYSDLFLHFKINQDIKEKMDISSSYKIGKLNIKNSSFYSFKTEKQVSKFSYSYSQTDSNCTNFFNYSQNNLFFIKHKDTIKDKRIKNDPDTLEIEKFLGKFQIQIKEKEKSTKKNKSKKININSKSLFKASNNKNNKFQSNPNLHKHLDTDEFIKKCNTTNIKMNEEKINNIINNLLKEKENKLKLPTLIIHPSNKEIIESYSKKSNNILNSNLNQNNDINSSKNNSKTFTLTFRNEQKKNAKNNQNNKNKMIDFRKTIFNLITNKNYCSYNKKYRNYLGIKTENNSKEKDSKLILKKSETSGRDGKFKNTIDFMDDLKKNKREFTNNNQIICDIIVENGYNRECLFRKKNNIKPIRYLTIDGNKKVFINDNIEHNLSKMNYMTYKIKKKRGTHNCKKNIFFQNALTSKEMIKYGDIYF
jgi:hypothetical protein